MKNYYYFNIFYFQTIFYEFKNLWYIHDFFNGYITMGNTGMEMTLGEVVVVVVRSGQEKRGRE